MTREDLWDHDDPAADLIDVPAWVEQDIDGGTLEAIVQGGCASGAYMPAVTYYDAQQTMAEHGDDVLQYLQDTLGELPKPSDDESWSGMAVHYLSCAVEVWAQGALPELLDAVNQAEDEEVPA